MSLSTNYPAISPSLTLDFANTGRLDPRITFTRASPAVYYDGVTTALAEQNLLSDSVNMLTSWTRGNINVTTGITAPDGSTTAIKIAATAVSGQHYIGRLNNIDPGRALSIYARAAERSIIQINQNTGSNTASFNLSTGVVASSTGGTASIVNAGGGWYRCIFISNDATRVSFTVWPDNTTGTYTGDGTSGLFIWAPQYEQRDSATAYTATTTLPITNYIPVLLTAPANTARFDHNPVTNESLGLLIEGTRDNLVSYSAAFDNAYWTKLGSTITPNTNVAPDGTLTAATMTFVSGTPQFFRSLTKTASAITYTLSCYAKAYTASVFQLQLSDNTTGQCTANFNLATGVVTGTTAGTWTSPSGAITPVGNGWYRCSLTGTSPANTGLLPTFVCPNAGAIFVWGAQLEAGAFATSYIATVATSQSRQADLPQMTGTNFSSWFNVNEGTFYAESAPIGVYNSNTILAVSGGSVYTTGNGMLLRRNIGNFEAGGNNTSTAVSLAQVTGTFYKTAFGYTVTSTTTNTLSVVANGSTPATLSTLDFTGTGTTHFIIGALTTGQVQQGNLLIRKIAFYPRRLTNNQLQNLTESP